MSKKGNFQLCLKIFDSNTYTEPTTGFFRPDLHHFIKKISIISHCCIMIKHFRNKTTTVKPQQNKTVKVTTYEY